MQAVCVARLKPRRLMRWLRYEPTGAAAQSDDGDSLDVDEPAGLRLGRDADERGGRGLLAEELLTDRGELGAVADIDEERRQLDNIGERSATGLDLGLQGGVGRAGLGGKISGMPRLTLGGVVDLAGDEQNGSCARDFDRLGVSGRVEHALRRKALDLGCHIDAPLYCMDTVASSRP